MGTSTRSRVLVHAGRRMAAASAIVLALLAGGLWSAAPADGWHVGGSLRVSQGAASLEDNPSLAFGADGQIYAVYSRFNAGARDILLRADQDGWAVDGRPVFTTFRVVNDVAGTADWGFYDTVPIAVDPLGPIYVAWIDYRDSATTGGDIRIARSDNFGSSFGASVRVSDFTGLNEESYPDVAVGPSGNVYVVYGDDRDGNFDAFFSTSTDQGATWSPSVKLNDVSSGSGTAYYRVAVDSQERIFVTWTDFAGANSVMFDRSTDYGATWGADVVVAATSWVADLAVGRNDVVHVAWQDDRLGDAGVYYTRSVDHGASFLPDGRVNDYPMGGDPLPKLVADRDGRVFIAYIGGGPPGEFQYVGFLEDGSAFYTRWFVTGGAGRASIGVDPQGNAYAIWSQNDGGPSWEVWMAYEDAPPAAVTGLAAAPGGTADSAVVTWNPNTEIDLSGYNVYRTGPTGPSVLVAFVPAGTQRITDAGLTDGRWYYTVYAVDRYGHTSNARSVYIDIGLTTDQRLDNLQSQLDQLQTDLGNAQTDIDNLQSQNDALQADLDGANAGINDLSTQLGSAQTLNMILLIVVIVLSLLALVLGMRKKKAETPVAAYQPPMQGPPPPTQ